jgi:glycosyltransferase involved in cell wall biosynthesis
MIHWIHEVIEDIQPDVFVPNLSVQGWYAARWVRLCGIPTVACHRSDDEFHWAMVDQFVLGEGSWAVSGLVCVAQDLCRRVSARHPRHTQLEVIPSGVPMPELVAEPDGPIRLVYVGRLVQKQKRICEVASAICRAVVEIPGTEAVLIGEGSDRPLAESVIAQYDLAGRVKILGGVPPDLLHKVLRQSNVLVLLSDYEGTPGSLMDGMCCGLVPVCLDITGGVRELVLHEQTGLLVADRNGGFVEAIRRLSADPGLRRQLAFAARLHIEKTYSLALTADRWESFLTRLVQQEGPKRRFQPPVSLDLPAVVPGLSREDVRAALLANRHRSLIRRVGGRTYRTVRRIVGKAITY